MLEHKVDDLLVAQHVPHAIAREDEEEILGEQRHDRGIGLVGQDRALWVGLELGISESARAREVRMRFALEEARPRVHRTRRAGGRGAPPDARDLEDSATGLPDAKLLVLAVGSVVLREAHSLSAAAEHRPAVAHVRTQQLKGLELGAVHEHDQRRRAVLKLLAPRQVHQLSVGERESLFHGRRQPASLGGDFAPPGAARTRRCRRPLLVAARDVVGQVLGHVLGRMHAPVTVEDAKRGAESAEPGALQEAILLGLLFALPRLRVRNQRARHELFPVYRRVYSRGLTLATLALLHLHTLSSPR